MGEGERLLLLLKAKRYEQTDLARVCGVTKNAVNKWTKERDKFSRSVWEKVSSGLVALGLNPADVRLEERSEQAREDLTQLVSKWPRAELQVIKRVLEADEASRVILLAYINGALRNSQ